MEKSGKGGSKSPPLPTSPRPGERPLGGAALTFCSPGTISPVSSPADLGLKIVVESGLKLTLELSKGRGSDLVKIIYECHCRENVREQTEFKKSKTAPANVAQ